MSNPRYPSLYQINTRVWLTELSRTLGRPRHAGRHSGRRAGPPGRDGLRLGLVPERLADRPGGAARLAQPTPSGAGNSRRRCRTCARRTSPAPGSPSPATPSIATSAATRRWPASASGCATRPAADARLRPQSHGARITPGSRSTRSTSSPAPRPTWPARRRTTRRVKRRSGDRAARLRPRPVLPRLARHAAAQLRQPGHAGGDDRRAA